MTMSSMWKDFFVKRRRRHIILLFLLIPCFFFVILSSNHLYNYHYHPSSPSSSSNNYFADEAQTVSLGYLVETPKCRIMNIPPFHESISHLVANATPAPDCKLNRKWTFVKDQALVINVGAVQKDGFSLESITCCYWSFSRVEQDKVKFDFDADSKIKFSSKCQPLEKTVTPMKEEFVRVHCSSKYWPWSLDLIYRAFHAIPLLSSVKEEAKYWEEQKTPQPQRPPNVVLLGIDSMSRLSFHRNMPKTLAFLQEDLGAVEMLGYTKLGENTHPNAAVFSSGYTLEELRTLHGYDKATNPQPADVVPFIWSDFKRARYATAFLEDSPFLATFNYMKIGFLRKPTDYYLRPFMLGVNLYVPRRDYWYLDCIGDQSVDEMILSYMNKLLDLPSPSFIYTWVTNLAHGDLNAAQNGDAAYRGFLERTNFSNTILFFMSDHGYRYGPLRETFSGWFEDKLPNFWVYIPEGMRSRFPDWQRNLVTNSRRLSSPYDLYATLRHILSTFTNNTPPIKTTSKSPPSKEGISLFSPIPLDRDCPQAGIPDNFCACSSPKRLDVLDPRLSRAAQVALNTLNSQLISQVSSCAKLRVSSIHAGGIFEKSSSHPHVGLVVAFYTEPGNFLFEANVQQVSSPLPINNEVTKAKEMEEKEEYKLVGELLRMNKISTDTSCASDKWEKFCYCS